jgi:hypothetical protein
VVTDEGKDVLSWQETELLERAPIILDERRDAGLEGLVSGLDAVIISTEPDRLLPAVGELLSSTGLSCTDAFSTQNLITCTLSNAGSASLLLCSHQEGSNPFLPFNNAPLARPLPNTRLETLIFSTSDINEYAAIQKGRGVKFLTDAPVKLLHGSFIQTAPSQYTGNSLGFIEWHGIEHSYRPNHSAIDIETPSKPTFGYLKNIFELDHAATRVRAQERNAAILEYLALTNYHYDFAVYVKSLNSITSVARRKKDDFAMVFTSGIMPDMGDSASGPTEKFIRSYGTRVHHIAFHTEKIDHVVASLKDDGRAFLLDLVGSPEEGLKQIFTVPSPHTMLVTEYIKRYGGFDGFFTKSNVELLTKATERQ